MFWHPWLRNPRPRIGRRRTGARHPRLVIAIIAVCATTLFVESGGDAASSRSRTTRAMSADLIATRISITVATNPIKIGQPTTIRATLHPIVGGRLVVLRRQQKGRLLNVGRVTTDRRGVAVFRQTFSAEGNVVFRATADATPLYKSATSAAVTVDIVTQYPFVLAGGIELRPGDSGPEVVILQQRLSALGYWLGRPGGYFGDLTEQAVFALEKAAGINRSGIVGSQFVGKLNAGTRPVARTISGNAIEVDVKRNLVMFVRNGSLQYVLNTSTGGGYTYASGGSTAVATTPRGVFHIGRIVNGLDVGPLGALWRPRYFYLGFAIHGSDSVPPVPVSHGCVRVSNPAMDWIWTTNLAPVGTKVWVY